MFEFDALRDKRNGNTVRKLEPFCDFPNDKEKEGLTIGMLMAVIDEEPEHTHYACAFSLLRRPIIISFWRCDCFKMESGLVFYEANAATSGHGVAVKADSRDNALLMLGALGVTPSHRWFPEEALLDRLEGE